ncbi:activating transcription factor 7-interacting protein 1 isoform X2 [Anabrus simplex]
MKQFDSPDASLPTPSKLDFKIMKDTPEDIPKDTQNNGQLRLTSPENLEVQNGPKKLLEIVDLNSSLRGACDSSVRKDVGWVSSCSAGEKENVISANGVLYESGSVPAAQSDAESGKYSSRIENDGESSTDQDGNESANCRVEEHLVDCNSEENIGNESTIQVSRTSVCVSESGEDQLKSIDSASHCKNEILSSETNVNGDVDLLPPDNLDEQQYSHGNGKLLSESLGEGEVSERMLPRNEEDQSLDEPATAVLHSEEELSSLDEPPVLDSGIANKALDLSDKLTTDGDDATTGLDSCSHTVRSPDKALGAEELNLSDAALRSKDVGTVVSNASETLATGDGVLCRNLLRTRKEVLESGDTDSFDSPLETGDKSSEVGDLDSLDDSIDDREADSLDGPPEEEADEPDSLQETIGEELGSQNEPEEPDSLQETIGEEELGSQNEPEEDEPDSLEGPVGEPEEVFHGESEVADEADSLQDTVEEHESVSHEEIEEASEPDLLQEPIVEEELVPNSSKSSPNAEIMEFEEHSTDEAIEFQKLGSADDPVDTDVQVGTDKLGSRDLADCKDMGLSDEVMDTCEQADADPETSDGVLRTAEDSDGEGSSCDVLQPSNGLLENNVKGSCVALLKNAELKSSVSVVNKIQDSHKVQSSDELVDVNKKGSSELDCAVLKSPNEFVEDKKQSSSEELSKDTKLQSPDDSEREGKQKYSEPCDKQKETEMSTVCEGDRESHDKPMESNKSGGDVAKVSHEGLREDSFGGKGEGKSCEKISVKTCAFSEVSYKPLHTATLLLTNNVGDHKRTLDANLEDFEEDLRAIEDSMWLDDFDKSRDKLAGKRSAPEDAGDSMGAPCDNAEQREERLTRKRSSEGDESSETSKRTKVSTTSGEGDSDLSSETSRDCDISSKRPSDSDVVDKLAKKARTAEAEKEETSYRSNLDKIIDQVATGVLNSASEVRELQGDDSIRSTRREGDKKSESSQPKASNPMPFMRKLHSEELRNLNRNDLEELVVQKLCEVVTERCNVGELRQRTQYLEQMVEQWRKKAQLLSKQVRDMEMVMKRFANDQRMKKDRIVLPVKITRSVGLQVHMGQTNQVGLSKNRTLPDAGRNQLRRRPERTAASPVPAPAPAPAPAASPAPATPIPKTPTPTSAPSTPQKVVSPSFPKTTTSTSTTNTSTVTNSPIVRQVTSQPSAVKSVSTPVKAANTSRSVVVNTSAAPAVIASGVNSPARSTTTTVVANRVVKSSTTVHTPIAPKPNQDLIDLTDEEDRARGSTLRNALAAPTDALVPTTASITSVLTSTAITTSVAGRGIRVVQPHQLTGSSTTTAAILTPTGTTNSSGQRLAYLVPTSSMPAQQRQLLLASSPQQVRAGSVMSMPGRPTIVFKSGPVVSMSQGGMSTGTMVQAGVPTSSAPILRPSTALATVSTQQRPGQLRMPVVTSVGRVAAAVNTLVTTQSSVATHPAPLPSLPPYGPTTLNLKLAPPKPELKISKVPTKNTQGIVLSWNMTLSSEHEEVASYQLYAYQEGSAPPSTTLWKKVGDVKALPLPMACTLTQFQEGHKYHFAVRAVDVHMRCGQFSAPGNIMLTRK